MVMHALENTTNTNNTIYNLLCAALLIRSLFLLPKNKRYEPRKYQKGIDIP